MSGRACVASTFEKSLYCTFALKWLLSFTDCQGRCGCWKVNIVKYRPAIVKSLNVDYNEKNRL